MKRANGTGSVYRLKNKKYKAVITLGYGLPNKEGKRKRYVKSKTFGNRKDAVLYLKTYNNQDITQEKTLKNAYDEWSKLHYTKVSKAMENCYKAAFKHCYGLYNKKINTIKHIELQAIVDGCQNGRRTKADIKSVLSNIYDFSIKNEWATKNLAELIELPKKEKSKNDAFTIAEINKLWKDYNNGHQFTGYLLIMIYTGMRYGELDTIFKGNVYLDEKRIVGGIKTDAGKDRDMPIADKIFPIVEKLYYKSDKKLLEMHEKVFYSKFYETLERCEIRKLKPHCCRHTFATLMANAGVQPAIIKETAGHEDYSTTMIYTHIQFDEKLKAVNMLK